MRHASLFSGIGGFDLAAQWMGWDNVFQVEIDNFCQKVLQKNFPNVARYGDIKQFDGTKYTGKIDVLTGGFPCQPFSLAGQRKGKNDDRYLWPEMLRVIGEIKPLWIVGENVAGIKGVALHEVLTSLENKGYHTETYIIPACAVNAPHRRDRFWIIAHTSGDGWEWDKEHTQGFEHNGGRTAFCKPHPYVSSWITANANASRLPLRIQPGERSNVETDGAFQGGEFTRTYSAPGWREFPTQSHVCGGNDGLPNRVDRIKSLGNAIVPQVAFEIFKAISSNHP